MTIVFSCHSTLTECRDHSLRDNRKMMCALGNVTTDTNNCWTFLEPMAKTTKRDKLTIADPGPFFRDWIESVHCHLGHNVQLSLHKKCTAVVIFSTIIASWCKLRARDACALLLVKFVNSVCLQTEQVNDLPRVSRFYWIVIFLWQLPGSQGALYILAAFSFAFHELGKYPCL